MEVIKNKRILGLIGIIGLILGILLPYYTISIWGYQTSISLWGYWEGKVIFVLILATGLIIFKDFIEKYVPQLFNNAVGRIVEKVSNPKVALVPTILVAIYAIYLITELDVASEYIKYGIGFYSLWIGIIALFGHAIFYKKPQSENKIIENNSNVIGNSNNKKICPNCHYEADNNANTCIMCDNKL